MTTGWSTPMVSSASGVPPACDGGANPESSAPAKTSDARRPSVRAGGADATPTGTSAGTALRPTLSPGAVPSVGGGP